MDREARAAIRVTRAPHLVFEERRVKQLIASADDDAEVDAPTGTMLERLRETARGVRDGVRALAAERGAGAQASRRGGASSSADGVLPALARGSPVRWALR